MNLSRSKSNYRISSPHRTLKGNGSKLPKEYSIWNVHKCLYVDDAGEKHRH